MLKVTNAEFRYADCRGTLKIVRSQFCKNLFLISLKNIEDNSSEEYVTNPKYLTKLLQKSYEKNHSLKVL